MNKSKGIRKKGNTVKSRKHRIDDSSDESFIDEWNRIKFLEALREETPKWFHWSPDTVDDLFKLMKKIVESLGFQVKLRSLDSRSISTLQFPKVENLKGKLTPASELAKVIVHCLADFLKERGQPVAKPDPVPSKVITWEIARERQLTNAEDRLNKKLAINLHKDLKTITYRDETMRVSRRFRIFAEVMLDEYENGIVNVGKADVLKKVVEREQAEKSTSRHSSESVEFKEIELAAIYKSSPTAHRFFFKIFIRNNRNQTIQFRM